MQKWEYCESTLTFEREHGTITFSEALNEWGEKGWELAATGMLAYNNGGLVVAVHCVFKRPRPTELTFDLMGVVVEPGARRKEEG